MRGVPSDSTVSFVFVELVCAACFLRDWAVRDGKPKPFRSLSSNQKASDDGKVPDSERW